MQNLSDIEKSYILELKQIVPIQMFYKIMKMKSVFDSVFFNLDVSKGKELSRKDRDNDKIKDKDSNLVYGEIKFFAFAISLMKIIYVFGLPKKKEMCFFDIGSGTGKSTIAASLLCKWKKCSGYEILESLQQASVNAAKKLEKKVDSKDELQDHYENMELNFHNKNIMDKGFSMKNCTIGFANSTCFDKKLMQTIASKADKMEKGSYFITFTKSLPSENWTILEKKIYKMSWGNATVFIQRKEKEPKKYGKDKQTAKNNRNTRKKSVKKSK